MAELIGAIILGISGGVTIVALLTVFVYLMPERTHRVQDILEARPGRSFLVGLVNFAFFGVLAALLSQNEGLRLFSILILLGLLALATVGLGGVVVMLRQRLYPPAPYPLVETLKTAVLLVAAGLAPVAGWFILTPIVLLMGLGATVTMLMRRNPPPKSAIDI